MTPYRSKAAHANLQEGIKKMAQSMSPAAQVRRDFRLGRPAKTEQMMPLHPAVVWERATEALANFRQRMRAAGLNPAHAIAAIVYIKAAAPQIPRFISLEQDGKDRDAIRAETFEILGGSDSLALGMVFRQFDEQNGKQADFPYFFTGLSEMGLAVLKKAVEIQAQSTHFGRDVGN